MTDGKVLKESTMKKSEVLIYSYLSYLVCLCDNNDGPTILSYQ